MQNKCSPVLHIIKLETFIISFNVEDLYKSDFQFSFMLLNYLKVPIPDGWRTVVFWLGYTNSSINPFIYAVKFKQFRPAFKDSLRWILCQKTNSMETPHWTSTNTNINFKVWINATESFQSFLYSNFQL